MLIPTFKMPTIRQEWQCIQQGNYAFSIDLKDTYLHIPIIKCHHDFYFYLEKQTLSVKGFAIWVGHSP